MRVPARSLTLLARPTRPRSPSATSPPTPASSFRFHNGSRGQHDLPEIMGGGVALIDADGDGRLDLYFCQRRPDRRDGPADPPGALFRNEGDGTSPDATATRAPGPPYAMGAAVGDFDGDGRDDLLRHRLAGPAALSE